MGTLHLKGSPPFEMPPLQDVKAEVVGVAGEGACILLTITAGADSSFGVAEIQTELSIEIAEKLKGQLQAALVTANVRTKPR
jgi:hypothetical protein